MTGIWLLCKSVRSALGEGSEMETEVNMGMWIYIMSESRRKRRG